MVVINCAYTEQINPAGATPVLTRDQVWNGLQRKIRKAQDFVPIITGCDVLEESENEVTREAHFKERPGYPAHSVKEVCKSYFPTRVDFWQPNGALITNTVSYGPSLEEGDMNMTYTFEWRHEDVKEGSEEHKKVAKYSIEGAKMAVHNSIEAMRKMAGAGELD
ncbi:uncharacterized protein MYCGRDRAFT_42989 [Zymoseptoria tritici IPO323]|uniref:DUF1857-domain-containing protein n=1 Tax=Zymoseptoria tritici (strain CBS 115943 / IPO323) TaxID=336722 RepID=F9XBQ1_ZYMTI|nr:uncharacterized protein MYCGRDRAFT_42989 [Zymoseptoria tritici IPO323]EGP87125.1 hypothetical protein MYCGRDRAFT_42989 [Zymoseptoria tritici IPO323]